MQKNLYSVNRKESTTEFNAKYPHTLKKHLLQRLTQFLICHLLSILFICRKKIRTHSFYTHKKNTYNYILTSFLLTTSHYMDFVQYEIPSLFKHFFLDKKIYVIFVQELKPAGDND